MVSTEVPDVTDSELIPHDGQLSLRNDNSSANPFVLPAIHSEGAERVIGDNCLHSSTFSGRFEAPDL